MAINSFEKLSDKIGPTIVKSSCSKFSNQNSRRLLKIDYAANDNVSSSNSKCEELKKNASPYLAEDRIEMLSRITEKRLVHKKTTDFISSFPLAVNIYKASSDEFKACKKSKKVKKSVLTLPNEPAPLPQLSTVSDMNDSEYNDKIKDERNSKPKRGKIMQTKKKSRISKAKQIFDRDAEYCSRLNIDLDNSSTDMINQFTGDGKKSIKRRNIPKKSNINSHDVWAMLRNMNRFPFRASPPFSEDSITSMKQRKTSNKHRNTQMDAKFIETCTTEEFTFFSNSFSKSPHNSQSSIDRITVVDKQDAYQEIREELKVVNNKIPSYVKNHKDIKKLKSNAKARLKCAKVKCYKGDNVEAIGHNDVNLRQGLPKNLRDKVQNQENKLPLTYDATNKPNLGCINNCLYCHDNKVGNEFNDSDDLNHLYGNSDSSKGDIIKAITGAQPTLVDQNKTKKMSPCASQGQMNGITKVVVSKGQNIVSTKRVDPPNRKPRLVTTMPSAAMYPKFTQADIKRRLANIKFPLVILSRDQLTSTPFRVSNYEPPQLAGLNEHIWPFMQNWQKKDSKVIAGRYSCKNDDKSTQGMNGDCIGNYMKINKGNNSLGLRGRNAVETVSPPNDVNIKSPKIKPMRQIKERMLQFLHKTSPCDKANKKSQQELSKRCEEMCKNVTDVSTNTQRNLVILKGQEKILIKKGEKMLDYVPSNTKQPCVKGRWASDFIENVIKKIKNGVYYNQEEKGFSRDHYCNTKEDSVQTEMNFIKHTCCKDCVNKSKSVIEENYKTCDLFQYIPGFDDKPSDLQIETIDTNQIAIKHCITNIVVQFDVAMQSKINNVLNNYQSFTCRPVSVTESHTNIFKSNTTIVNAMLPAELCSILPNTIRTIVNSKLDVPRIVDKVETQLTAITELPPYKTGNNVKHLIPAHIDVSPPLRILGKGNFSNNNTVFTNKTFNMIKIKNLSFEALYRQKKPDLLPNIQTNQLLICQIDAIILRVFKSYHSSQFIPEIDCKAVNQNTSTCMELQPYLLSNKQVIPAYKFNILEMVSVILSNQSFNIQLNVLLINPFFNLCDTKGVNIISMGTYTKENQVSCIISDITVNSIYNGFQESLEENNTLPNILKKDPIDKYNFRKQKSKFDNCKNGIEYCVTNRNKKRTFIKLYKKCKSMSNVSSERLSTALRKITNLDDFFLALGSSKVLASAIDGETAKKILSSIKEMNNWINEITPRQALLILLLANKKDTPNLLRYRPVILQGIAVKRITRASELDLEVEVIEREKLNTFSPFEGISYLPASVENQDCLLEELYWIAKTTASDYQKPFDESSERLLKSLLEKRKKLNPSYLRVMARYVGLGLLKSPK